jgi:hypothetical protein
MLTQATCLRRLSSLVSHVRGISVRPVAADASHGDKSLELVQITQSSPEHLLAKVLFFFFVFAPLVHEIHYLSDHGKRTRTSHSESRGVVAASRVRVPFGSVPGNSHDSGYGV